MASLVLISWIGTWLAQNHIQVSLISLFTDYKYKSVVNQYNIQISHFCHNDIVQYCAIFMPAELS